MSKIRTPEQLDINLAEAIIWRKRELNVIKHLVTSSSSNSEKQRCFTRAGIALLYAHWEGFIKEAALAYLNFVSVQGLKYEELAPNFIAFAMKAELNKASQTNKAEIYNEVVDFFLSGLTEKSNISYDDNAINTESNLKSHVLKNIVYSLGLDYSAFATKEILIDERLLKQRNDIAHGKYLPINEKFYVELHEEILGLMELFLNQVINAASLNQYKRNS